VYTKKLEKINNIVDWEEILAIVQVVDRTDKYQGGAPQSNFLTKNINADRRSVF